MQSRWRQCLISTTPMVLAISSAFCSGCLKGVLPKPRCALLSTPTTANWKPIWPDISPISTGTRPKLHRKLNRQFQELRLANAINRAFDQEDVLTIYLNRVYLGPNVYGIEAAAKRYLGKNASDMTLEESAAMVSMIRSPRMYSPLLHPDRATQRRDSILDEMVIEGSVSQADADRAKSRAGSLFGVVCEQSPLPSKSSMSAMA
jgi:hypothetical protein